MSILWSIWLGIFTNTVLLAALCWLSYRLSTQVHRMAEAMGALAQAMAMRDRLHETWRTEMGKPPPSYTPGHHWDS